MDADPSPTVADETPTLSLGTRGFVTTGGQTPNEHWAFLQIGDLCVGAVVDVTDEGMAALEAALASAAELRSRLTEVERREREAVESAEMSTALLNAERGQVEDLEADLEHARTWAAEQVERVRAAEAERDRMLPVVEAAKAWAVDQFGSDYFAATDALLTAVNLYSSTVHPPTPETPEGRS